MSQPRGQSTPPKECIDYDALLKGIKEQCAEGNLVARSDKTMVGHYKTFQELGIEVDLNITDAKGFIRMQWNGKSFVRYRA